MHPQRKSPRKIGFDYRLPGGYFVTICTHQRTQIFGIVVEGEMQLNGVGEIARSVWTTIPNHRSNVTLDAFVVMPNHVHGIVWLAEDLSQNQASLSIVIASYKSEVSKQIRREFSSQEGIIWQKSFHDHFIRTPDALDQIRAYVAENPRRWHDDTFYGE